ncbi:MAG: HEAT repeat domain-containing protein [Okeania sp. SIO3I5]|uniref:HEAT repeat domain-containing protein n=1 Tax=Okeania sp. SIO3I5 TaxID=2607805 RepID=UPI0013BD4A0C|nr:HEAT repeat domain-containing protein [Okeania sp. SIO3I5]
MSSTTIPALVPLLEDSESNVRWRTANALGKIGSPKAVPRLISLLEDSDSGVRMTTVNALGKIGSPNIIVELTEKLRSDRFVKQSLSETTNIIQTIQQRIKYYKITPKNTLV